MATQTPKDPLQRLREPFPDNQVGKLPKPLLKRDQMDQIPKATCKVCGQYHAKDKVMHLDFVGHAAVTDRLLDVDPQWTWEPLALDEGGLPRQDKNGGLWIKLTICGVTRLGYGDAPGKGGGDGLKECIGDAIRNAAMRFGVALDLWHKGELHAHQTEDEDDPSSGAPEPSPATPQSWEIPSLEEFEGLLDRAYTAFKDGGKKDAFDAFREKWKARKTEPAEKVLTELAAFVNKLEAALKAKQAKDAEAA